MNMEAPAVDLSNARPLEASEDLDVCKRQMASIEAQNRELGDRTERAGRSATTILGLGAAAAALYAEFHIVAIGLFTSISVAWMLALHLSFKIDQTGNDWRLGPDIRALRTRSSASENIPSEEYLGVLVNAYLWALEKNWDIVQTKERLLKWLQWTVRTEAGLLAVFAFFALLSRTVPVL